MVIDIQACACNCNPVEKEKFLYTRQEAARALGISLRSIAYLIQQQRLATRRIGGRVLIHKDELRRFARGHHTEAIAA